MKSEFLKLKQLDRIEYILLRNNLNDWSLVTIQLINSFIWIYFLVLILALLVYIALDKSLLIFNVFYPLLTIMKYAIVVGVLIDIFQFWLYYDRKKKLNKRFFKE